MKNPLLKLVCIATFLLLSSFPAFAWDDAGHKLVAYIAWQQMSPAAREKAVKTLLSAPEDAQIQTLYPTPPDMDFSSYPVGTRSKDAKQREFFTIVSYWADIVRDRAFPSRYKYHRGTWHYLNIFWKETNGKVELVPELKGDKENAVERLFHFDKILRSEAPDAEKAIALAWVLHIAGDVHQPLHASGRVTELEPKGDQGGNMFSLSPPDAKQRENLHWLWDSILVRQIPRRADASDGEYLLPIASAIMKKYPAAAAKNKLEIGKFDVWLNQSYEIASTKVFPPTLVRGKMPSPAYMKSAQTIAEGQIAIAGYRLGSWLNDVFGEKPVAMADAANKIPCRIIRQVSYPVSKTNDGNAKMEIGLLDLCPANRGMVARPMYPFFVNGKSLMFEYDVVRIFKNGAEAQDFAKKNGIKDVSF